MDRAEQPEERYDSPRPVAENPSTADQIVDDLKRAFTNHLPPERLPRDVVQELADIAVGDPAVLKRIRRLAEKGSTSTQPMLASVLHLSDSAWRPGKAIRYLQGAYLAEAHWDDIDLHHTNLTECDLGRSWLRGANLEFATLIRTSLAGGRLQGAKLVNVHASKADFSGADLTGAELRGEFGESTFAGATLDRVSAASAIFRGADFTRASLRDARLNGCRFQGATFEEIDLTGADLQKCRPVRVVSAHRDVRGRGIYQCKAFALRPGIR